MRVLKHVLSFLLMLTMTQVFIGCGSKKKDNQPAITNQNANRVQPNNNNRHHQRRSRRLPLDNMVEADDDMPLLRVPSGSRILFTTPFRFSIRDRDIGRDQCGASRRIYGRDGRRYVRNRYDDIDAFLDIYSGDVYDSDSDSDIHGFFSFQINGGVGVHAGTNPYYNNPYYNNYYNPYVMWQPFLRFPRRSSRRERVRDELEMPKDAAYKIKKVSLNRKRDHSEIFINIDEDSGIEDDNCQRPAQYEQSDIRLVFPKDHYKGKNLKNFSVGDFKDMFGEDVEILVPRNKNRSTRVARDEDRIRRDRHDFLDY